jgi:hypothetical protein
MLARAGGWFSGESMKRKSDPVWAMRKLAPFRSSRIRTNAEWAPSELDLLITREAEAIALRYASRNLVSVELPELGGGIHGRVQMLDVNPGRVALRE